MALAPRSWISSSFSRPSFGNMAVNLFDMSTRASIRPEQMQESSFYFDKLPYELLLVIFDDCKDLITAYALVRAVMPRLDTFWEKSFPILLQVCFENSVCDNELVNMKRLYRDISNSHDIETPEWYYCFTFKSSLLWSQFLHNEAERLGYRKLERRYKGGTYLKPLLTAGPDWKSQLSFWTREILHLHMEKYHKGVLTTQVLHECLFNCNILSGLKRNGNFIAINMNLDERRYGLSMPSLGKLNQRILLPLDEFAPLVELQLLEWCRSKSALQKHLKLRCLSTVREDCGDFINSATRIVNILGLSEEKAVKSRTKAFVSELRDYDHIQKAEWEDIN